MQKLGIIAMVTSCLVQVGCGVGTGPFRNVLVCLHNPSEVSGYGEFLDTYANAQGFIYTDNTDTMLALSVRGNPIKAEELSNRASLDARIDSDIGYSFWATNWDRTETAVAHSFAMTGDVRRGSELADQFIEQVKTRWEVFELPLAEHHYPTSCEDAKALTFGDR